MPRRRPQNGVVSRTRPRKRPHLTRGMSPRFSTANGSSAAFLGHLNQSTDPDFTGTGNEKNLPSDVGYGASIAFYPYRRGALRQVGGALVRTRHRVATASLAPLLAPVRRESSRLPLARGAEAELRLSMLKAKAVALDHATASGTQKDKGRRALRLSWEYMAEAERAFRLGRHTTDARFNRTARRRIYKHDYRPSKGVDEASGARAASDAWHRGAGALTRCIRVLDDEFSRALKVPPIDGSLEVLYKTSAFVTATLGGLPPTRSSARTPQFARDEFGPAAFQCRCESKHHSSSQRK